MHFNKRDKVSLRKLHHHVWREIRTLKVIKCPQSELYPLKRHKHAVTLILTKKKNEHKSRPQRWFTFRLNRTAWHLPKIEHKSNRLFPSSLQPPFQDESTREVFVMNNLSVFIHIEIRTNYHNENFALRLALKERLRGTSRGFETFFFISGCWR